MARKRNDLSIYDRHAAGWWDPASRAFASLRQLNRFRLQLLDRWLGRDLRRQVVVDLGCGGGLLAWPLSDRGARVVAVDLSLPSLRAASRRQQQGSAPWFARADATSAPLARGCADLVLLADVVEHLDRPAAAVREAARLLRPGGHLYVSTINRTWRARVLAVCVAEGLGLVPRRTHDPRMFVSPADLDAMARSCALRRVALQGEGVALVATLRRWAIVPRASRSVGLGYSALFHKPAAAAAR